MSSVGDQFKGLDMKNLIGGPLTAAAESSILLARSTADFINDVGFDAEQKTRSILFKYQRNVPDPDGNASNQEMAIEVPLLAIVPIPNLQIDEVNVIFDMEVKTSERSEDSKSGSGSLEGSAKFGPVKVAISGSVSASSSNTRSSDNSAKYHVDVRATNHGVPEGLARVLDMMAANVAPNVVSSKAVDKDGKELSGKDKERNQKMKELRDNSFRLENAETAAKDSFDLAIKRLIQDGEGKRSAFQITTQESLNTMTDEIAKTDAQKKLEQSNRFWDDYKNTIKDTVIASSKAADVPKLNSLKKPPEGIPTDIDKLQPNFESAITDYKTLEKAQKDLDENKRKYNAAMMETGTTETKPSGEATA